MTLSGEEFHFCAGMRKIFYSMSKKKKPCPVSGKETAA
jgi:hypothetical protein